MKNLIVVLFAAGLVIGSNSVFAQKKDLPDPEYRLSVFLTYPIERKVTVEDKGKTTEYKVYLMHPVGDLKKAEFVLDDNKIPAVEMVKIFQAGTNFIVESVPVSSKVYKNVVKALKDDGSIPPEILRECGVSLSFGYVRVTSSGGPVLQQAEEGVKDLDKRTNSSRQKN